MGEPPWTEDQGNWREGDNLFVAEFTFKQDRDRVQGRSPWIFGKHALIFQEYDELLLPSEIIFDRMDIWVKILNVPLGWMNETRGTRAMGLIGKVKKMDVDKFRKASGLFLRACVTIDVNRRLRRGVLLKTKKTGDPDWFDIQYEKLPYYCMSYGVMGHSELQCALPIIRNELGKLPYDVKL